MMRTPVKNATSEERSRVLGNSNSTITLERLPCKVTRAALNSQQMAAILYEKPIMMRTPVKNSNAETPSQVLRNLGSTITIGGSPKNLIKSTRKLARAATSSQQMTAILHEKPSPRRFVYGKKENVASHLEFAKRTESTKLIDNSCVSPLNESVVGDFSAEFFSWLKKTEKESDSTDFARLKADLCQLVGRYTLEFSKQEK